MNTTELNHLSSPSLSHLSRSVYTFFIKPRFEQNQKQIDLVALVNYMNTTSSYFPTSVSFEAAAACLMELEDHGLIKREQIQSKWQGCEITLPCFVSESEALPEKPFVMTLGWKPGPNFSHACILCGLEDFTYTQQELKSFTSYWKGNLEMRNQHAWERAFAQRLLKSRTAKTAKPFIAQNTVNLSSVNQLNAAPSAALNSQNVPDNEAQQQLDALFKK